MNTIKVYGEGQVPVEADSVTITVRLNSQASRGSVAAQRCARIIRQMTSHLSDHGIKETDLETANCFQTLKEGFFFLKWQAEQDIKIHISDIDKLGEIYTCCSNFGSVLGYRFHYSKENEYLKEARKAACLNAKEKAIQLAANLGSEVLDCLHITDTHTTQTYDTFHHHIWQGSSLVDNKIKACVLVEFEIQPMVVKSSPKV